MILCFRVLFELLWRDYFRFVALKYGKRIFSLRGVYGSPYLERKGTVSQQGKVKEEAVRIVLYKCSSHSACVTTLGCYCRLTVSTEVPQHHSARYGVDTETFAPNVIRYRECY